jgi:hypothetical protein
MRSTYGEYGVDWGGVIKREVDEGECCGRVEKARKVD